MSMVTDLTAKLLLAERERDSAREENVRLRNKLLECAKECSECNGTGVITLNFPTFGEVIHEDCPACHDIRSVLA